MMHMNIKIDPELKNLLPRHSAEELQTLEANCLADPNHENRTYLQVKRDKLGHLLAGLDDVTTTEEVR
jgi:hypothetical protein